MPDVTITVDGKKITTSSNSLLINPSSGAGEARLSAIANETTYATDRLSSWARDRIIAAVVNPVSCYSDYQICDYSLSTDTALADKAI